MDEHYCQYLKHWDDGSFLAAGRAYSGEAQPCNKPAKFRCGDWWFCAEHYDLWIGCHDEVEY